MRENRRRVELALLVLATFALLGCVRYGTVRKRFAYDYKCNEDLTVTPVAGGKYVVRGCHMVGTYVCVGGTCVQEYKDDYGGQTHGFAAPSRRATAAPTPHHPGEVSRSFDEETNEDRIRGTFVVEHGIRITLVSIPARELETVYVRIDTPRHLVDALCTSFDLLVNKRPITSGRVDFTDHKGRMVAGDRFQFQDFKPLASRYPEFAVRLCGKELSFSAGQITSLQKFLIIHSELAEAIQAGQAEPSFGTTL